MSHSASTTSGKLQDQVALVTGSSRGMGGAMAMELARAGADVIVHARQASADTAGVLHRIEAEGRRALLLTADLVDTATLDRLVQQAWDWQGGVDIWVNNAGADVLTGEAAGWSFEQKLERLWQVDVMGTLRLSRLVGPRMQAAAQGGTIINIGWDQAEQGMSGDSGEMFSTIKGAIMAFTRSLAQSLAPKVRVNCVAPGWIKTAWGDQASDYWQQRAQQESLRQRWGTPEDVAQAVCFLASPAADFVTGQVLNVNGGFRYGTS